MTPSLSDVDQTFGVDHKLGKNLLTPKIQSLYSSVQRPSLDHVTTQWEETIPVITYYCAIYGLWFSGKERITTCQ